MALFKRGKTWWYDDYVDGKRVRKSTKCTDKKDAEQWVKDMKPAKGFKSKKALIQEYAEVLHQGEKIAVDDAFDRFLEIYKKGRPSDRSIRTKESWWKDFHSYIKESHPEIITVHNITEKMAQDYLTFIIENGRFDKSISYSRGKKKISATNISDKLSATTINKSLMHLRHIFRVLCGLTETDSPFEKSTPLAKSKVPRDAFSFEELDLVHKCSDEFVKSIFLIGIYTGLRQGDICMLKWADIKDKVIATVPSKTGKNVRIPILPGLSSFLTALPRINEFVLPEHAEMYQENAPGITWRVKKCLKDLKIETTLEVKGQTRKASIKGVHSLRHTFCYIAAMNGVPIPVIQSIVGHMDAETTAIYTSHVNDADAIRHLSNVPDPFTGTKPVDPKAELLAMLESGDVDQDKLKALVKSL